MATATGTVGSKQNIATNTQADQSFEASGCQRIAQGTLEYEELIIRSRAANTVFLAAAQAGIALTNLAATCTGFCLTNPVSSGRLIALIEIGLMQTSTAAAAANAGVQLALGTFSTTAVTQTTPLTVRQIPLGVTTQVGVGLAATSVTLPAAPVAIMNLWQPSVSATATVGIPPYIRIPLNGLVVIEPGCSLSLSALTALSAAAHMVWKEIPIPAAYV